MQEGIVIAEDGVARCFWGAGSDEYRAYHDEEWGFPVRDDRRLFEKLCLEGFQAGLSWLTILRKREAFRRAFVDFDFERVARFGRRDVTRLLGDASIVRHRGKIESTINNATRCVELVGAEGSLASYVWRFEPAPESRPQPLTWAALQSPGREGPEMPSRKTRDGSAKGAAMTGTDVATYARERPGMSAFVLEDGIVYHTYSTYARGLDGLWGMYQWLDRAPKGRNETGYWLRHRDKYDDGA